MAKPSFSHRHQARNHSTCKTESHNPWCHLPLQQGAQLDNKWHHLKCEEPTENEVKKAFLVGSVCGVNNNLLICTHLLCLPGKHSNS